MVHDLRLLFTSPSLHRVEAPTGTWYFAGNRPEALARVIDGARDARSAISGFDADDAIVVRVGDNGRLDAYRSVTGTRNVYLLQRSDGTLVVTDHFRNALRELPVHERRVSSRAIADHLLFRDPVEPRTYVTGIRALPHGTHLRYDRATGEHRTRLVERLAPDAPVPGADTCTHIDETLASVLRGSVPDGGATNMLSGGVDSTLIHTYLDDPTGLVMSTDSPEFAFEVEKAERASDLLDASTRRVHLAESEFLRELEASIDALGFPSHYNQTVLTNAAFRAAGDGVYINGAGADALFGLPGLKGARLADRLRHLFSVPGATTACRWGLGRVAPQAARLAEVAASLDQPPCVPESYAQRQSFFSDPGQAARCTDRETVTGRVRRQHEYVQRRVEFSDSGRFDTQMEFSHLLSTFGHNTVAQWRQLGAVHGQSLVTPFTSRRMAQCALSVPVAERYVGGPRNLTPKHLLKSLLDRRLPRYPVREQKGSGSLPIGRYFETGPLSDVFDRYDPPEFVPPDLRETHVDQFGPLTWNLVTFAVWRDRVFRNPDIGRVPGTRVVEA